MPEVIDKAIDEAARIIHDDPRRAAQIYLTHEPSGTLNGAAMDAVIRRHQGRIRQRRFTACRRWPIFWAGTVN